MTRNAFPLCFRKDLRQLHQFASDRRCNVLPEDLPHADWREFATDEAPWEGIIRRRIPLSWQCLGVPTRIAVGYRLRIRRVWVDFYQSGRARPAPVSANRLATGVARRTADT
jgi:hypothetical protein